MNNSLNVGELTYLKNIFAQKKWDLIADKKNHEFDRFCNMLEELNYFERAMILDLTSKFTSISQNEYLSIFIKAYNRFVAENYVDKKTKIVIIPACVIDDRKVNSSSFLMYLIKSHLQTIKESSGTEKISLVENKNVIPEGFDYYCIIDDFIGSGETILGLFETNKLSIDKDKTIIISLVAMREGLERIHNEGYAVYTDIICEKGISGTQNELLFKNLMENIENRIKVEDNCKFGWKHSEALVRMVRVPNNTFPIYWFKNNYNKNAPFPR